MAEIIPIRRGAGTRRRRRRWRGTAGFRPGPIVLMLLSGILSGLLLFGATRLPPPARWLAAVRAAGGPAAASGRIRVVDGDTFLLDGERIRLADIDTPEVHGRCPFETALAARATARLRTLLAQGPFDLHPLPSGRDRDRYGRQLRIVTRGGRSIGDVMVAEGLARTWSGRREGWCQL